MAIHLGGNIKKVAILGSTTN